MKTTIIVILLMAFMSLSGIASANDYHAKFGIGGYSFGNSDCQRMAILSSMSDSAHKNYTMNNLAWDYKDTIPQFYSMCKRLGADMSPVYTYPEFGMTNNGYVGTYWVYGESSLTQNMNPFEFNPFANRLNTTVKGPAN